MYLLNYLKNFNNLKIFCYRALLSSCVCRRTISTWLLSTRVTPSSYGLYQVSGPYSYFALISTLWFLHWANTRLFCSKLAILLDNFDELSSYLSSSSLESWSQFCSDAKKTIFTFGICLVLIFIFSITLICVTLNSKWIIKGCALSS